MPARSHSAFTLIELLVTMAVIATLAGITITAINGVQQGATRARAAAEIAALNTAIESYKTDNGIYPGQDSDTSFGDPESDDDNPNTYEAGSIVLYAELVGEVDDKHYFIAKSGQISGDPHDVDTTYLVDPWGYAWGYAPVESNNRTTTPPMNIGFYDLWSSGGSSSEENASRWIVNWPDEVRKSVN